MLHSSYSVLVALSLTALFFSSLSLITVLKKSGENQSNGISADLKTRLQAWAPISRLLVARWIGYAESKVLSARHTIRKHNGWTRYGPIWFCVFCGALLAYAAMHNSQIVDYQCPDNCYGVVTVEDMSHKNFEFVNIKTGKHKEMRFCTPANLFAGYVVMELRTIEGMCEDIDAADGLYYIIARGKHRKPGEIYFSMTYDDGQDRPVLANNCHNNQDGTNTACDGNVANFQGEQNAESARPLESESKYRRSIK